VKIFTLGTVVVVLCSAATARADDCHQLLARANLTRCVLAASPEMAASLRDIDAAKARVISASPLLPSNPNLAASIAKRSNSQVSGVTNWYLTLQQEVEIAGQRGLRAGAARADLDATTFRGASLRLDVLTMAWTTFFDALAARDAQELVSELYDTTTAVAQAARAKADEGLVAPVDADVAEATSLRVLQELRAAERDAVIARAMLGALVGAGDQPAVDGELTPIAMADTIVASVATDAAQRRPDVLAAGADQRTFELHARTLERKRIPNPTFSLFLQSDGFNETVRGVGVAVPIPLPGNIGHTNVGEIAEARALADRAGNDRERLARDARLAIVTQVATYRSLQSEIEAFTPERLQRARRTLGAIADEVRAGRLAVRDAVLAQQTLVELLRNYVATRRSLCITSVQLVRAAGASLEEVTQ
jgi:cobalt-zinc-cadmium efflux system outer membrane protein